MKAFGDIYNEEIAGDRAISLARLYEYHHMNTRWFQKLLLPKASPTENQERAGSRCAPACVLADGSVCTCERMTRCRRRYKLAF